MWTNVVLNEELQKEIEEFARKYSAGLAALEENEILKRIIIELLIYQGAEEWWKAIDVNMFDVSAEPTHELKVNVINNRLRLWVEEIE